MAKKKRTEITTVVNVSDVKGNTLDTVKPMSQYEMDAFTMVMLRVKQWEDKKAEKIGKWKKYQDNFRSVLPKSEDVNNLQSRIFVPVTESAIRALVSKYIVALFLKKPFFRFEATKPEYESEVSKLEAAVSYLFDKTPDFLTNWVIFIQSLLVYGTAFGKIYWRKIERNIKETVRDEKTGKLKVEEKTIVKYSGFYFEQLSIENIGFDPTKKSFEDSWKVHFYWKTIQELKALNAQAVAVGLEPIYKNLDKLVKSSVANNKNSELKEASASARKETLTLEVIPEYQPIEVIEYWSEDSSRVITILNRQVIGRDAANTSWNGDHPFIHAVYEPMENEVYGRGVCEKLENEQDAVNTLFNQIIDNTKLLTNQMFIGLNGFVPVTQIIAKIGKVIMVDDMNALKELKVTPIGTEVYNLIASMKRSMETSAGSNQLVTAIGSPITKEQTAQEVGTINRLGNELHALNIMLLETPALDQMVTKAYHLVRQFMGEALAAKIYEGEPNDENWDNFPAEDMPTEIIVKPVVGLDVMSKEQIQTSLTQMIGFLANIPGYDVQPMVDLFLDNANVGKKLKKKVKKQIQPQSPVQPQGTQTVLPPETAPTPNESMEPNVTDFSNLNNSLA